MDSTLLTAIGSGGGLVLAAIILWGIYKLAEKTLGDILGPAVRAALETLAGIKEAIESQTKVLEQMRVEAAERQAELRECIEVSAKETRHSIRNALVTRSLREEDDTPRHGVRTRTIKEE